MGWMGSLVNGLSGNLNEISPQETEKEFGAFLMEGEAVQAYFRLVRDVLIVTDKRIIDIDKQGATGTKLRVSSIDLSSVFRVTVETAGFGVDDSEITIEYIVSPYYRMNGVETAQKTWEFPRSYQVESLYRFLQEAAYRSHQAMNG